MSADSTDPIESAILGETELGSGWMGPRPSPGFTLEITTGKGDRIAIDNLADLSVTREHTAVSSWSATVPMEPGLSDRVLSKIRLRFGGLVLFNGRLESLKGDVDSPLVELSGRGIEADLLRGELTIDFRNRPYWEAIRQVWRNYTDWDAVVVPPNGDDHPAYTRIAVADEDGDGEGDGGEYSGTPMEILQTLHEECGMRFTVMHSSPTKRVESYPLGKRNRRHDWDVLGGSRDQSAADYANRVVVTGALKLDGTGDRITGVAQDDDEIEAMRERGVGDDGAITYPIRDSSITVAEKAKAKAESTLEDLVDKDAVGGTLDVKPTVASPGYQYAVPEFGATSRAFGEGNFGEGTFGVSAPQFVSLNRVQYSISNGEASCTLDFSQIRGLADTIRMAIQQG